MRIESPLDFMHAISGHLDSVRDRLPLRPGAAFTVEKIGAGRTLIEKALDDLEEEEDPRSRVRVVLAGFDRCDENAARPLLDVYYRVFTTNYNSYLGHTFEIKRDEVERPAVAAAETAAETQKRGFLRVQPTVSYNRSRQLFAGGRARLRMPGGFFESAEVSAGGSSSGNEQAFELSGSRANGGAAIDYLEYRVSYRHSDLDAGDNRLREGLMRAQLFGATKPLGAKGIVLRYGASLEGGNQQTDLEAAAAGTRSQADSGYGGLKTYLGATMRTRNFSATASYGLQLGARGASTDLDFVKHIGDVGLNARWQLNREAGKFHKFVTLEAQLTGGAIKTLGTVPVAQRFFGGNVARDFIEGDTWRIRSEPFIRSIPENRLGSGSAFGNIGGTGFYSANLTLAVPVWGYPLVPADLTGATDAETGLTFFQIMDGQKESARKQLVFRYLNEIPAFQGLVAGLRLSDEELKQLQATFATLPWQCPAGGSLDDDEEEEEDTRPEIEKSYCNVKDLVTQLREWLKDENKGELPSRLGAILKAGDASPTCVEDDTCSRLKALRAELEKLAGLLRPAGFAQAADAADGVRTSLEARQPPLTQTFNEIMGGPDKQRAEQLGTEDMKQLEPVLDSFVYELNWFSVSPVAVFDAARVWPDRHGTRFGVGGGVRLSVVNFNVTAGYSFNPSRKAGEGRGAMFFSMDVTDLFR